MESDTKTAQQKKNTENAANIKGTCSQPSVRKIMIKIISTGSVTSKSVIIVRRNEHSGTDVCKWFRPLRITPGERGGRSSAAACNDVDRREM